MEHLMIDDIGDKVRRKMGMIEKTVDPNKLSSVVKRAERPFALCFSQGIAKPGNGKAKLSLKIALMKCFSIPYRLNPALS